MFNNMNTAERVNMNTYSYAEHVAYTGTRGINTAGPNLAQRKLA